MSNPENTRSSADPRSPRCTAEIRSRATPFPVDTRPLPIWATDVDQGLHAVNVCCYLERAFRWAANVVGEVADFAREAVRVFGAIGVARAPLRHANIVDAFRPLGAADTVAARPVAATIFASERKVAAIAVNAILVIMAAGVGAHWPADLLLCAAEGAFIARVTTQETLATLASGAARGRGRAIGFAANSLTEFLTWAASPLDAEDSRGAVLVTGARSEATDRCRVTGVRRTVRP